MAKTWKKATVFDATPETLLAVMTNEDFQIKSSTADPAVAEARVEVVRQTDDELILEVHNTEYSRGMTGIDKSKTEHSTTRYEWDLSRRRGSWTYTSDGSWSGKVDIRGVETIEPAGDKARLISEATFSVNIRLIGGKIEGFIIKEIDQQRPTFEATVREFCQKLG